jgi:hypothetical protein
MGEFPFLPLSRATLTGAFQSGSLATSTGTLASILPLIIKTSSSLRPELMIVAYNNKWIKCSAFTVLMVILSAMC